MSKGYRRIAPLRTIDPHELKPHAGAQAYAMGWPHGVGCVHCRNHGMCNECGGPLDVWKGNASTSGNPAIGSHCTNGRCAACHMSVCGQGDAHAPYRPPIPPGPMIDCTAESIEAHQQECFLAPLRNRNVHVTSEDVQRINAETEDGSATRNDILDSIRSNHEIERSTMAVFEQMHGDRRALYNGPTRLDSSGAVYVVCPNSDSERCKRDICIRALRCQIAIQDGRTRSNPDECAARSEGCSFVPNGPNGEIQCQYCGRPERRKA